MKKILYIALFILGIMELNAHGACLVDKLKQQKQCTGGAAPVQNLSESASLKSSDREALEKMYQTPAVSTPKQYDSNGFPIINPSAGCLFGICLPK